MRKLSAALIVGLIFLLSSCKKEKVSGNEYPGYYYMATIGGVDYKVEIPKDNADINLKVGSALGGLDDVVITGYITNLHSDRSELTISKGLMHNYQAATDAEFKNFFAPGSYNYAPYGSNGISIAWRDVNWDVWTSEWAADQLGSSFKIISSEVEPGNSGVLQLKIVAQFNCNLSDGNGNVKAATGTFVGLFGMH